MVRPATKQAVLDAGVDLFLQAGPDIGVTRVKLASAAARAGYTTGAAYKVWERQEDFHRDLAITALGWRDRSSVADLIAGIRGAVDAGAPMQEVVRVGAEINTRQYPDDARYFAFLALRSAAVQDPELLAASDARAREGLAAHAELYEALLVMWRRRVKSPFTMDQVCRAIAALDEGFAIQDAGQDRHPRIERTDLDPAVGTTWTLLGVAIEAVVLAMTESLDDVSETSAAARGSG